MTTLHERALVGLAPLRRLPALVPVWEDTADVVVVGAGAAGLSAARVAAEAGRSVVVLVKGDHRSGATAAAQGGLAAVTAPGDSVALHASDTEAAGAGLCDADVVSALVSGAPAELAELRRLGARFDVVPGSERHGGATETLALTREGGHSRDRVVHAGGDASGAEVDRVLRAALPPSVRVLAPVALLDVLLDVTGAAAGVLAARVDDGGVLVPGVIRARAVVLATGGFGQAWATTTSPAAVTGDGAAAALRAGATLQDMEFVQFHPTVLWSGPGARGQQPLLTEALRGEGAVLVDATGTRVMAGVHPRADLAPRDVVSAAMVRHLRNRPGGVDSHLFLDATHLGADLLERRFPTVLAACRARGIDPVREVVPVAPGAHYTCGGIAADLSGRTDVTGLYAVGEVACSGVHGANRLASNSLTEALLAGRRCGDLLARSLPEPGEPSLPDQGDGVASGSRDATAALMSREVGVLRDAAGLGLVLESLAGVGPAELSGTPYTLADLEAASLHTVSTAVTLAAAARTESRGCHRRDDHDTPRESWHRRLRMRATLDAVEVTAAPRLWP